MQLLYNFAFIIFGIFYLPYLVVTRRYRYGLKEKLGFLYQNASLYVLPSLYEGSELSILTPFAYNLPIASSLLPSITAILKKDDVVFFRPMSISEIKEALKKALSKPSVKQDKRDMSLYSVDSVSKKILNVFLPPKKI